MKKYPKIEYPKYTREQDNRCKLTDEQILEIRSKREGIFKCAKKFNVSVSTINRWRLSDAARNIYI